MCGRYSLAPEESGDIMRIVREIEAKFGPGSVSTGKIRPVCWGFPGFQGKGVVIKARGETALGGRKWVYHDSPIMQLDEEAARRYDEGLEPMEKTHRPSQEEFYILSHSTAN